MTTAVTSPAGSGARVSKADRRLPGAGFRSRRWRRAVAAAAAVTALVSGCLLVTSDIKARAEIRTTDLSLATVAPRLNAIRAALGRDERRLAAAEARRAAVTRSFDAAQSTLSATQAGLARAQAGIRSQGVDLGVLDTCLSGVEEALNQIAVGQTSGGLASLRASSSSCSTLNGAA